MSTPPALSEWRHTAGQLDFEKPDQWYKGEHCNRFPQNRRIVPEDVLLGWKPDEPLIRQGTKVLAFGSCFAEYFIKFLTARGYNRWHLPAEEDALCDERLLFALSQTFENIFVIHQQFRWAFGEFTPQAKLWFTRDRQYFEASEDRRLKLRRSFEQVEVLVITLGLSEIWFDAVAGEPMWRSIPERLYEPGRHVFRRATVNETVRVFHDLAELAARHLPQTRFIFTVSPIPLIATFRDQSAVTANQASKAVLRAAIDEFISDEAIGATQRFFYFPSHELAFHCCDHPYDSDNRHLRPEVAAFVLDTFSRLYTDLSMDEPALPSRDSALVALEQQVRDLEQQLMAKERVIRELDAAARERLHVIEQLAAAQAASESL